MNVLRSTVLPSSTTFDFFRGPSFCYSLYLFTQWNGVLCSSSQPPLCANYSSSSVWGKGDLPLRLDSRCSCSACYFVVHSFSSWVFSSTSFLHCVTKLCTACFVASFLFFSTELPASLLVPMTRSEGECQSTSQRLMTS